MICHLTTIPLLAHYFPIILSSSICISYLLLHNRLSEVQWLKVTGTNNCHNLMIFWKKKKIESYQGNWRWTQVLSSWDHFPAVTNELYVQISRRIFSQSLCSRRLPNRFGRGSGGPGTLSPDATAKLLARTAAISRLSCGRSASELLHVVVGWPVSYHVGLTVGCLSIPTWHMPLISAGQPFGVASSRVRDERQKVWGETEPPHGNHSQAQRYLLPPLPLSAHEKQVTERPSHARKEGLPSSLKGKRSKGVCIP